MFVLELRVLPVLRRSPEGSGVPMDFADAVFWGPDIIVKSSVILEPI